MLPAVGLDIQGFVGYIYSARLFYGELPQLLELSARSSHVVPMFKWSTCQDRATSISSVPLFAGFESGSTSLAPSCFAGLFGDCRSTRARYHSRPADAEFPVLAVRARTRQRNLRDEQLRRSLEFAEGPERCIGYVSSSCFPWVR